MHSLQTILTALIPVFGMVALGMAVRRLNWLTEEADRSLMQLCVRLLFPCLVLREITRGDWFSGASDLVIPPAIGFGLTAMGFAAAAVFVRFLGPKLGIVTSAQQRTFVLCAGMFNYGYIPIPLVRELFKDDSITMSTLLLHNVGVDTAMWTLGILILAGKLGKQVWTGLLNPVVISIIAAVALKLLVTPWMIAHPVPHQWEIVAPIAKVVDYMAMCAIPMSLVLTGATIADVWRDADLHEGWASTISGCALRLGAIPLLFIGVIALLHPDEPLRRVIAIQAAMPAAIFPVLLAKHYGGDSPTAVRIVIATHAVGLLTIPLWLALCL